LWLHKGVRNEGRECAASAPKLSPRESQVLELRRRGLSYKEIGSQLGIGKRTVKEHLQKVRKKTRSRSNLEAVFLTMNSEFYFTVPIIYLRPAAAA